MSTQAPDSDRLDTAPARAVTIAPATAHVDPARWPDVARVPDTSAARATIARLVVRRALAALPLRVAYGSGAPAGGSGPLLTLRDPEAFFRRIGADGLIGFGESYMAGEWHTDDLVGVLTVLAANVADLVPRSLQRLRGAWARRHPAADRNTLDGAKDNIHRHYDLSNDLFALFLDETMTYSSAIFDRPRHDWTTLADAQHRKIDRLLDLAGVTEGTRLLEIGTGWGELALRAAERGATVLTVTLSREQRLLAMRRIERAGYADRVTVELRDYREVRGTFDAVVSVEMIEAVGEEYWPVYFDALDRLTAPGGRVAIQAITMPHDRMVATRNTYTWIHKYIFPGGILPSVEAIGRLTAHTRLRISGDQGFGTHYARTLALWRERFTSRAAEVAALGFDGTFRRMWEFYLAYSEAGFAAGYLDVRQILFTKTDATAGGTR
ncbi:class I SAM-dependent methyltransferase [Streptantibioticus silvisoli]|uniref:class I SAM-dependent methyltransferase n=1 Tax=Streptantibioticus silvisoli TaxID=2705255 RepID=UPI003F6C1204